MVGRELAGTFSFSVPLGIFFTIAGEATWHKSGGAEKQEEEVFFHREDRAGVGGRQGACGLQHWMTEQ